MLSLMLAISFLSSATGSLSSNNFINNEKSEGIPIRSAMDAMRAYVAADELRAVGIVNQILPSIVAAFDKNGDGRVSAFELSLDHETLKSYWARHLPDAHLVSVREWVAGLDKDGDGFWSPSEIIAVIAGQPGTPVWFACAAYGLMKGLDADKDGRLSERELATEAQRPLNRLLVTPALAAAGIIEAGNTSASAPQQPASTSNKIEGLVDEIKIPDLMRHLAEYISKNKEAARSALASLHPEIVSLMEGNGNGVIDVFELGSLRRELLNNGYWDGLGIGPIASLGQLTRDLDTEIDGKVSPAELSAVVLGDPESPTWKTVAAFALRKAIDEDGSGGLSAQELSAFTASDLYSLLMPHVE